jgi:putative transposase
VKLNAYILIDEDNYLLQLIQYIHLNPVRARIVEHPQDYLWSSHKAYIELSYFDWLTTDYILGYFSNQNHLARISYIKFIEINLI